MLSFFYYFFDKKKILDIRRALIANGLYTDVAYDGGQLHPSDNAGSCRETFSDVSGLACVLSSTCQAFILNAKKNCTV